MNQSYTNIETQIEIRESGKLTQAYKRTVMIKHTKAILNATAHVSADLIVKTVEWSTELFTPVKLDLFDHVYGTNLRSQYFSGKRTQRILQAKRSYGL